ncbi:MAG TPA: 2-oxoglutarate dehydrogenase E1 component [Candidatus Acidoferrales bacterium]|jgi:2-oxoglutarate dehydrogenase E1 component|nr:2-oxoglutarate dehydrogenase E1 component [Candidatus Acidoferrales bacterium]
MSRQQAVVDSATTKDAQERIWDAFRRWGYLQANLDPLGDMAPVAMPELDVSGPDADAARQFYCGTIGVEFMHIPEREKRQWIQRRMEAEAETPEADRERILDWLVRAEIFEQVLQTRYLGTKRYSLEGESALLPLLDAILNSAAEQGAVQAVLAMSHRGRLNVMVHVVGRGAAEVFARFEDVDPRSVLGGGDVKYHMGATGSFETAGGKKVGIHLVSNPSHLEAVDPVAIGRTRAKQERRGDAGLQQVVPVVMHGDAAFAGQGIWAETLNMAGVEGFTVGGSVHIIVNNLIGFTTIPRDSHSSRFSSDLAKRLPIPVFHVNAEDPEAVTRVGRMAIEYRYAFGTPVVVDLIGYRRHGHSEVDDPTITQPLRYRKIEAHPPLWQIYAEKIGVEAQPMVDRVRAELDVAQKSALELEKNPPMRKLPPYWDPYRGGRYDASLEVNTGVAQEELAGVGEALTRYPDGFHIHPKVKKLLEQRLEMAQGKRPIDYGMAEALAFGTLLKQRVPVRLSGQDSRRGTFNQRHAALIDIETEEEYVPLQHVGHGEAWFEAINSTLSEASVLGFEYGFSRDFPEALVLWEAQFGDFANGAQIVIDQFISAGEDKWNLLSGVVLLLPHGYEGQGPEHSSARLERFLQLAARDNIQICQPSTAAQYFHLLRRQALRAWRKPLVVFTPKSMLRNPVASSSLAHLTAPRFQNVIPDAGDGSAKRVLLCTGKIGHELAAERKRRKDTSTAIIFLEQLYPFPEAELASEMDRHANARDFVWVQEEPANMGALAFLLPRLERLARGRGVLSIKRSASASPATGSHKAHEMEQHTLLTLAFGGPQKS